MKIYSIYDKKFKAYGNIVSGIEESVEQIQKIVNDFKTGKKPEEGTFTRGHYYRGVL